MKSERKAISTRTRFEIFKRDGFKCSYCGSTPPAVILHIDHIIAISNGGDNDPRNLITACQNCNLGKSNVPLSNIPAPLLESQQIEAEKLEQLKAYNEWLLAKKNLEAVWIKEISRAWVTLCGKDPDKFHIVGHWENTAKCFLKHLTACEIIKALEITYSKGFINDEDRRFHYFCKICWNWIKNPETKDSLYATK